MKRFISSLLLVMAASFANTTALADPITHPVDYICPATSDLGYFGTYVAGFGKEILSARTTNTVYFKSMKPIINVPSSLVNYSNSGANYDAPTGYVTCSFRSSNPAEDDFDISYMVTNGKGGQILSRTNNTIRVLFFIGLK